MDNTYTVYKHTAPNGKVYIGITCRKPEYRWNNGNGYKQNRYFYNAIQKYGWDNFEHTIISEYLSKEEACSLEIELIAKYNSNIAEFGYNHSTGGELSGLGVNRTEEDKKKLSEVNKGKTFSEETRKKISESLKGKKLSEEHKRKLSEAHKGEQHNMYGKQHTEETKRKMSESKKGEKHPMYGKHLSEEHRRKLSEAFSGEKHPMYGKHHSEKSKQKISEANSKKVMCVEKKIIYESTLEVERTTGIDHSSISRVCKGKQKTAGGYHWEYYEEGD